MTRLREYFHTYHDLKGKSHTVSNDDLLKAVKIKAQLVKATGKCNFHRLRRLMLLDGVDKNNVKVCPGFKNLVKKYNYRYVLNNDSQANSPQGSKDGPKTIPYSVKSIIGQYNYAKRETQDVARTYNRLRRHVTDTEILRDQIADALKQAHFAFQVEHNECSTYGDHRNALLAAFSDLHIGALVDTPANKYNLTVAKQRVSEYAQKLVDLVMKNDVGDLYIANLGDVVEQVYMRFTQGFDTELDMSDQIIEAINLVDSFLVYLYNQLASFGIRLHYTGIGGNHDRLNGNKKNSVYKDSVVTIVNAAVKWLAAHEFSSDYFTYHEPDDIYRTHLKINSDNIKIVHGDLDSLNKSDTLGNMSLNDGRDYKLLLGGHLHRHSVMEAGLNKYVVTSGSFKGPDDYSSKLGRVASVSQAAIVINQDGSMTVQNVELH